MSDRDAFDAVVADVDDLHAQLVDLNELPTKIEELAEAITCLRACVAEVADVIEAAGFALSDDFDSALERAEYLLGRAR